MEHTVKCNIVSRDIAGHKMDNEPQDQKKAGKRVVDSFSLKIVIMTVIQIATTTTLSRVFLCSVYKQR